MHPPSSLHPHSLPGTQCHQPSTSHAPKALVVATFANAGPAPVLGGDTPSVPGWGHGAAQVAPSRGWGRGGLAAGRVRLLAAPPCSSKESSTTASWDRRRQEVSEAACRAWSQGQGAVAEDANPFPGCLGQKVHGWVLPGFPQGAGPPAPKLPQGRAGVFAPRWWGPGCETQPRGRGGTLEHPCRDRCPSHCMELRAWPLEPARAASTARRR